MYCITKEDMKFGTYIIPARTRAEVINTPKYREAGMPGLQLRIAIKLFDMHPNKMTGVPVFETRINNELEKTCCSDTKSQMIGIEIYTQGDKVFLDAGDKFYNDVTLSEWQVKNILGESIPESLEKKEYTKGYLLSSVIEHIENEFGEWVTKNCHFKKLTKKDIENGEGFDGAMVGDRTLSPKGMQQFEEKQQEYKNLLETSGFTYEFEGGLIWE